MANPECFRGVTDRFGLSVGSFPGVVGCVDGTHIQIPGPRRDNSYYNRKGTHSVLLQAICNSKLEFIDVYCGWPGSAHDARVWENSKINELLDSDHSPLPTDYRLLGDAAYPLSMYLMVPFKDKGRLTKQQKKFNKKLSSTRIVIEQAYGQLFGRFRRLKLLDIKKISYAKYYIMFACILHNVCIRGKDMISTSHDVEGLEDGDWYYSAREKTIESNAINKRNEIMLSFD
nr:unnamed protein product [Callosobruchus analis]